MPPASGTMKHDDRAIGALIGLAVGDALGTTIEFKKRDSYEPVVDMIGGGPFGLKPGEWTDDTSMALCLADSLIASKGRLVPDDVARRFVRWWLKGENSVNGRCFDIGNATSEALAEFRNTRIPKGSTDPKSAGNGGIMRLAPAVLAARGDAAQAVELSRAQSDVTHSAAECLDAADLMARILHAGINGDGKAALNAGRETVFESPSIAGLASSHWRGKERDQIWSTGYVVHTLEAALWCIDRSDNFNDAVLLAVNLGHDADTVGAVTGQIAGAIWGYSRIPLAWRDRLAWHDELVLRAVTLWAGP